MNKKILTLCYILRDDTVLLAMKKRGFGVGRWNGFGGKVQSDETITAAAIRETKEESTLTVAQLNYNGILEFTFDKDPVLLESHVFTSTQFYGKPQETDEMRPQWFERSSIPYDAMWPADSFWLPRVLNGEKIYGKIHFKDHNTVLAYDIQSV